MIMRSHESAENSATEVSPCLSRNGADQGRFRSQLKGLGFRV